MNELLTMLDTKYKRLEYIQSTGTQYIDTGIKINNTTAIEYKGLFFAGQGVMFGVSNSNNAISYYIATRSGYISFWNSGTELNSTIPSDTIFKAKVTPTAFEVNNTLVGNYTLNINLNLNLYLFAKNTNGTVTSFCRSKIYYFKISENGVVKRNFVPVLRKSDNEIGMLDLVEGKFYGNAGTGKFTANLDTMYALIQGTPTVQDGRVSNFSATNYLKTKAITLGTNFEIKISFITPNDFNASANKNIIGFGTSVYWLSVISNGCIRYRYSSYSDAINYIETGILATNTKYDLILGQQQSGTIYLKYKKSSESEYITVTHSYDATIFLSSNEISFGVSMSSYPRPFDKSIDLNRSYIKIDDTKYKLQAVVGYSQPSGSSVTITNGVASGFSSSNYLTISTNLLQNSTDWEICFKYNTGNFIRFSYLVSGENNNNTRSFIFGCSKVSKQIYFYINYVSSSWKVQINTDNSGITIQPNSDYWIKVIFKNGVYSLYISTNGINYIFCQSVNGNPITACTGIIFGRANFQTTSPAEGSIDLNNTYIKINNKLWFNGLQA